MRSHNKLIDNVLFRCCNYCNEYKEATLNNFHKQRINKKGELKLKGRCKECHNKTVSRKYNKETKYKNNKLWRLKQKNK